MMDMSGIKTEVISSIPVWACENSVGGEQFLTRGTARVSLLGTLL